MKVINIFHVIFSFHKISKRKSVNKYNFIFRSQDRDQCLVLILSQFKESLVNFRDHKMRTPVSKILGLVTKMFVIFQPF